MVDKKIDFLVSYNIAQEEILTQFKEYTSTNDAYVRAFFDKPFLETQLLLSEISSLVYEKSQQTGVIKIYEQGNNRKDRYTSCSYANWFADKLEQDLLTEKEETFDFAKAPCCVSAVSFD